VVAGLEIRRRTARELDSVRLVVRGLINRGIADELVIAERTAEAHVEHVRHKLGVRSRAEIAAWTVAGGPATVPCRGPDGAAASTGPR
jgi:non-specific serine/threonine protein kinase